MNVFEKIISRSIDEGKYYRLTSMPKKYIGEDVQAIIPNLKMTNEGPILTALFLLTRNYICEIRVVEAEEVNFDVTNIQNIVNIRVSLSTTTVELNPETKIQYKNAKVTIVHNLEMNSNLEFVGEERDEWLSEVLKLVPTSKLTNNFNR